MWFHEDDSSGKGTSKRSRPNRRRYILGVNTRLNVQRRATVNRATSLSLLTGGLLLAAAALIWGLMEVGKQMFSRNSRFQIRHLVIKTDPGAMIGENLIREYIPIAEGMNIFGVDINSERDKFLRRAPNIRNVEITRYLPDTVEIQVSERVPLACVQQPRRPDLCLDDHGCIFRSRVRHMDLPVITGHSVMLKPGLYADGFVADAVTLLDAIRKMPAVADVVVVSSVNVRGGFEGRSDALRLTLADNVQVDLWWERSLDGNDRTVHNMDDLRDRLHFLGGVLRKARQENRSLARVNLTLDNYRENCPVTPM